MQCAEWHTIWQQEGGKGYRSALLLLVHELCVLKHFPALIKA